MENAFRIRNWAKFQHYKDRNPPWIKLHYELMSSVDWVMADDQTRLLMVVCMMIASRHDGYVPNNPDYIQKMSHINKKPDLVSLCNTGFFEHASNMLATCKHDASKCLRSVSASVSDSSLIPEGDCKGGLPVDFESFWTAYPKKTGKKSALKAWKAAKDKPDIKTIIAAITAQRSSQQWQKDGGQFIPHPATWLNQGRWADETEPIKIGSTGKSELQKRLDQTERNYREAVS